MGGWVGEWVDDGWHTHLPTMKVILSPICPITPSALATIWTSYLGEVERGRE